MFTRWLLFLSGVLISGLGVAFSTQAGLGTSPISSLPYTMTFIIPWSFGVWTVLINLLFILGQILLLGKKFSCWQFLQLPVLFLFGLSIDFGMWCARPLLLHQYLPQILWAVYLTRHVELLFGCVLLAIGISFQLLANVILVPGEGVVRAYCQRFSREFGPVKIRFDSLLVCSAIVISLLCLHKVCGLREGTLAAAFYVGGTIRLILPKLTYYFSKQKWEGNLVGSQNENKY